MKVELVHPVLTKSLQEIFPCRIELIYACKIHGIQFLFGCTWGSKCVAGIKGVYSLSKKAQNLVLG